MIKMETVERLMDIFSPSLMHIDQSWAQSSAKTEHAGMLIDIAKDLVCLQDMLTAQPAQDASYRRGRDSMGRYTSSRSYGGPDMGYGMPYERGYSAADKAKVDELCRELEFIQTRVGGAERDTIQSAIAELKSK